MLRLIPLLLALGCTVGPQPVPPSFDPQVLVVADTPAEAVQDAVTMRALVGAPGTVDPAEGVIVATPLDGAGPILVEPVRPDGSFELNVTANELRLQARNGELRSEPIDVAIAGSELRVLAPRHECLSVTPALESDFGAVRVGEAGELTLEVRNDCDFEVGLGTRFREGGLFEITSSISETLPPGASLSLQLRAIPTAEGAFEDTLFVDINPDDRRVLTLFVRGLPR